MNYAFWNEKVRLNIPDNDNTHLQFNVLLNNSVRQPMFLLHMKYIKLLLFAVTINVDEML